MYTGIGLETIPTQVTEDSKLKHHQVISWKISFPLLRYRFTWFTWCHLKGKATRDLFPSWMPGATQASSPVRVLSHNRRWEQIDLISTHARNSHHKTQYEFSTLNSSSEMASVKQLAGPSHKDSPCWTAESTDSAPLGNMPCHCLVRSTEGMNFKGLSIWHLSALFNSKEKF